MHYTYRQTMQREIPQKKTNSEKIRQLYGTLSRITKVKSFDCFE